MIVRIAAPDGADTCHGVRLVICASAYQIPASNALQGDAGAEHVI